MIEVRFHGRGGQGAVTAAEIVAQAAIRKGDYAQAFPSFGPERRGAPVQAFLRVSDNVLVLDPTLVASANPGQGLKKGGFIVINSNKSEDELKKMFPGQNIAYVDASTIAKEEMGINITNTTMLGALLKATGMMDLEMLTEPINNRFGKIAQKNINSYTRAFKETKIIKAA
jgi:pyruvate ferredoxin oxidoreductase gamma subunit